MAQVKIKAGRRFHQVTGSGDDRRVVVHPGGSVVTVTEAQARNFADLFQDPSATPGVSGETLTPDEQAALATFREEKRKQADAEAARVAGGDRAGQKVMQTEGGPSSDAKTADEKTAEKPAAKK